MPDHSCKIMPAMQRDPGVDLARGLAVLLMILCHAIRSVTLDGRPEWAHWVMAIEPLAQILFLFLLGYSLALSEAAAQTQDLRAWAGKQLRRGLLLWLLSAGMILLERSEWQGWVNMQGGFLGLAGKTLLLLTAIACAPQRLRFVLTVMTGILLWGGAGALEMSGRWLNGINAGNGAFLPLAAVAWSGWVWQQAAPRERWNLLAGALLLAGSWWLLGHETGRTWWEHGGRVSVAVEFLRQGKEIVVSYYSLRLFLALFWMGAGVLLITGLRHYGGFLARGLAPLGRHALLVYCAHLGLLGLLRIGWGKPGAQWLEWLCLALLAAMWLLAQGWACYKRRRI